MSFQLQEFYRFTCNEWISVTQPIKELTADTGEFIAKKVPGGFLNMLLHEKIMQ